MIYELRTYEAMPGRLPDLQRRFRDHTIGFFEKHGMKVIGFWTYLFGETNDKLVYMLAYDSLAERERAWAAFQADPDWIRVRTESDQGGPVVARLKAEILVPTDFSPLK
jgi:hypothetical protein